MADAEKIFVFFVELTFLSGYKLFLQIGALHVSLLRLDRWKRGLVKLSGKVSYRLENRFWIES